MDEVRRRGLACFGSEAHRFRLHPPLPAAEVERFEARHGVRLPEDYRTFLLAAGNGGAGPYYGLLPLERWGDAVLDDLPPDYLARPCPLRPDLPAGADWESALGCPPEAAFEGTLALATQGCTYYALLVVTGPHRGRVVYVNLDGGSSYFVRNDGFLSWYERWLDELLWGYDGSWFGAGLPGREPDLLDVVLAAGDPELREEALVTLRRLPRLRPETLAGLRSLLGDGSARVRASACHLLGKHKVGAASGAIAALAGDEEAGVRQAALVALEQLPGADWEAAARAALRDGSEPVVFRALCQLKDAGRLRREDVEPLFGSPVALVRRNALWAADAVGGGEVAVPDALLRDPDAEVRRYAYLSWGRGRPGRVAILCGLLREETDLTGVRTLINTLGGLADRAPVPALIELTRHADGFVREDAARALGKLGDRRAIPALTALLRDHIKPSGGGVYSTLTVAETARAALEQIERA